MTFDDYDDLVAESRPERPFSCGTDRDAWQARTCTTCIHDREQRAGGDGFGPGCPLLTLVLIEERTPAQWFVAENGDWRCIEYRREDDDEPGPEEREAVSTP